MPVFILLSCKGGYCVILEKIITSNGRDRKMDKIKIGCLTYRKLDILSRNAVNKINDDTLEIRLIEGLMEELTDKVKEAIKDGFFVFVGGGANYGIVKHTTEAHVVEIKLTAMDYIDAILSAKKYGRRIALVHYKAPSVTYLPRLSSILDVELLMINFSEPEELEMELINSGVDAVIGASLSNEIANKLGLPSILVYPGEETILDAIKEAKEVAITLQREKEKSRIIQTIIDFTPSGIIATDEKGRIITFNPAAEKIYGISSNKAVGSFLGKLIPQCHLNDVINTGKPELGIINQVNDSEIVVNRIPIDENGRLIGALATIQKVSEIQKTEQKIRLLQSQRGFTAKVNFSDIIGKSPAILEEIKKAQIYAKTNSNILIYGETGVGKELFSQSIHNYGFQQSGPFIAVNCAALPENLLESELFGYDEGAFTGSRKGGKAGLFEIAHQGTIFLDEIGGISQGVQARLLRVIQEKEVMRIGGDRIIPVNVRIIAATNEDIEKKIPFGFRDDLYYRLNVLQINIPPLREREDDVIDIFLHFVNNSMSLVKYKDKLTNSQLQILKLYSWPGNIRELQNVAERFSIHYKNAVRFDGSVIHELLVNAIGENRLFLDILKQEGITSLESVKETKIPDDVLKKLLLVFPGKKVKIAERLGISRTTLWRKIKE
jgi:propionate catabolism operon transcriptional regulator